ncbi:hypothetical protein Pmani_032661 [Petrolisthes manimaculis]|uniref:Neugrin n=1 Tax=Petrolisthes manimaculis TaxID=1843537 RepID=A0AAE1NRA4_9EUCA|nr:hypothetical protein Pmani_032661 [Petrolisthes manimaculis]
MAMRLTRVHQVLTPVIHGRQISTTANLLARGIGGKLRKFGLEEDELEDMTPEQLQAVTNNDFDSLRQNMSQLEVQAEGLQTMIRRKTIEHKYFKKYKPKEENFMTWSMKEQLRYLNSTDPDAWTPEVLSKAFPTSSEGVKKLLNSKWVPRDESAIKRHDLAVAANWKKHMKGKLGSARLIEAAFKKYSSETSPTIAGNTEQMFASLQNLKFDAEEKIHISKRLRPKNKLPNTARFHSGFLNIITSYEQQVKQRENPEPAAEGGKNTTPAERNVTQDNIEMAAERQNSTGPTEGRAIQRKGNESQGEGNRANLSPLTTSIPTYQGSYTQVLASSDRQTGRQTNRKSKDGKKNRESKKMMTFSEFMKQKS